MTMEAVRDSLKEAREFFRRCFDKELRYCCCCSWIFNPAWADALPDSNLAKFQREVYLFPTDYRSDSGLFFVFGQDQVDWGTRRCSTALERAFKAEAEAARPFRTGGMIVDLDRLDAWGTQHYRSLPHL